MPITLKIVIAVSIILGTSWLSGILGLQTSFSYCGIFGDNNEQT
jgi:hypothetical protein